jgi:hypothetical protein
MLSVDDLSTAFFGRLLITIENKDGLNRQL